MSFYQQRFPDRLRKTDPGHSARRGRPFAAIYSRNVFAGFEGHWGTYPNNLGHTDFPGCFRCHGGSHTTAEGWQDDTQDCTACHETLADGRGFAEILNPWPR